MKIMFVIDVNNTIVGIVLVHIIYTQCDSNLCYECADHSRKKSLTKSMIRDNKLLLLLN